MPSLYIHIPFCKKKCYYCDFNSYDNKTELSKIYIEALKKEIYLYKNSFIKTIYIGGGTPSLLPIENIKEILFECKHNYRISKNAEISIEVNPESVNEEKLKIYKQLGINRISIGLQSTHNRLLKILGRSHSYELFIEKYHLIKKHFSNINVDLIFGIPTQTFTEWKNTLLEVYRLKPSHISTYSLSIEKSTPFEKFMNSGKIKMVSNDLEAKMYKFTINFLKEKGYYQYEISNFALRNKKCLHNISYWKNKQYIGIGAGAVSLIKGKRLKNPSKIEDYIDTILTNKFYKEEEEKLTGRRKISEKIILGLRMNEGLVLNDKDYRYFSKEINELVSLKLLYKNRNRIMFTKKGLLLGNYVFRVFL